MTRQPAGHGGVVLPVAIDAEAHLELVMGKPIHRLYGAVTFGTIEALEKNVRLVPELNVIPHDEQPLPRDGLTRFIVTVLFLNPRVVTDDVVVAVEALCHCRDPGPGGSRHKGVTETTVDRFDPCMKPMRKRDGLFLIVIALFM
jgi:hypothetical protein